MFDQAFIDLIGENRLYSILDGKKQINLDILSKKAEDIELYFVLQHFIIKVYIEGYNKEACINYLKIFYNDFQKYPHMFCDSPIIKDKTLDLIFGNSKTKDRIKSFRSRFYDSKEVIELHNKKFTQELNESEKNRYYSYLILLINKKDKKYEEILNKEIEKIINSDFKSLSDIELKFYCQYVSNFALRYKDINASVMVGNDPSQACRGYCKNDYIFINACNFDSIDMLTKTVCHESRHTVQAHESRENNTLAGFEMAQRILFGKYLNTNTYDSYHRNYHYSTIELDAEHHGHFDAGVFFTMFKRGDLAENVRQNRREKVDNRNDYCFMCDENNKPRTIDDFIVKNLDKIILENPHELDSYPVLKNMYNPDGTRKPFSVLLEGRVSEGIDNRGIYDNFINYEINNGELDKIPIERINKSRVNDFINSLKRIYREDIIELKDYFKDNTSDIIPQQVEFSTSYKLSLANKLLSYVNNNYEQIVNYVKYDGFNNRHPIFDFLIDLRDFNIDDITNERIKNSSKVIEQIKELKQLTDTIMDKFNKTYIDKRMEQIPEEVRNSDLSFSNGVSIPFEVYFKKYIIQKMDSHQEITINEKKYYVGDLIRYYKNSIIESLKNNEENKTK